MSARPTVRTIRVVPADDSHAEAIASLRNDAADRLTEAFGKGVWSGHCSDRGVLSEMKGNARTFIARAATSADVIIGTMTLGTRKPWAIDPAYFTASDRPLYLTSMAVAPAHQRMGVGRVLLVEARRIAAEWPADAIRLDAFDADAGAGAFYAKCGFREVGRRTYRTVPLVYFELRI
jgi:GNAT superfamily N-acetyltransferase